MSNASCHFLYTFRPSARLKGSEDNVENSHTVASQTPLQGSLQQDLTSQRRHENDSMGGVCENCGMRDKSLTLKSSALLYCNTDISMKRQGKNAGGKRPHFKVKMAQQTEHWRKREY